MPNKFEQILDLLNEEAQHVFLASGVSFEPAVRGAAERTDVVVASIGFGGRDLRGALTLSASVSVWEALAPDLLGSRPIDRALIADFAGEIANMIIGRFRNALLRRNVEVACGTPTTIAAGSVTEHLCLFAQRSEWRLLGAACGTMRVRLDMSFREGFQLPEAAQANVEPVVTDLFF